MSTTKPKMSNGKAPGTGTARGNISQLQRADLIKRDENALQRIGSKFAINQNLVPTLNNLTIGIPSLDINDELTPEDVRGRMLGLGTYQNIVDNPHVFNTKETVSMNKKWSTYLTHLYKQALPTITVAANDENITDYSIGLAGVHRDLGMNIVGQYQQNIDSYSVDDRARLWVTTIEGTPVVLLPGSTEQRIASQRGLSVGHVSVKNPNTNRGYVKVGSKGWRDAIAKYYNGLSGADAESMEHLIGQGAVYGLGPVFAKNNIPINSKIVPGGSIRYIVPTGIENVASNANFFKDVGDYYDLHLKNPDQHRLGNYAAASFAVRHEDILNGAEGASRDDYLQSIEDGLQGGNLKGLWSFKKGNRTFNERRGLTAFPMRHKDGSPLDREQYFDKQGGYCNPSGNGVGISQRATNGGEFGYRLYKNKKEYISKAAGKQGQTIEGTVPLYRCGPTSDNVINANRQIYQAGQDRGTANYSLNDSIVAAQNAIAAQGSESPYAQFTGLTPQVLQQKYQEWSDPANFAKNGTNPYYMLDPTTMGRRGFAKNAPKLYSQYLTNPKARQIFDKTNVNQQYKDMRSNELFEAIQARPTTVANSRVDNAVLGLQGTYKGDRIASVEKMGLKPGMGLLQAMNKRK